MTTLIIAAAVLVALGVIAREATQHAFKRRLAEAGRSRIPPPPTKISIRLGS